MEPGEIKVTFTYSGEPKTSIKCKRNEKLEKRIVDIENKLSSPLNKITPTPINETNINSYNKNYSNGNYII